MSLILYIIYLLHWQVRERRRGEDDGSARLDAGFVVVVMHDMAQPGIPQIAGLGGRARPPAISLVRQAFLPTRYFQMSKCQQPFHD